MQAFSAAITRIFSDPNMAADAQWLPAGPGGLLPCRVVIGTPDLTGDFGEGRFVTDGVMIDVRVSEIATVAPGDRFIVGGETFEVRAEPVRDQLRLVWKCSARRVSAP